MNKFCGTKLCIVCGKPATCHHGHVLSKERMALGNLIDVTIGAGFCEEHNLSKESDENGCYGKYDEKYGIIDNIFRN